MKKYILGIAMISSFFSITLNAQYQYVGTYSGSQTAGFVDGTNVNARYNAPYGLAFDGSHTLYIADALNHAIRKIDITTGIVSTILGNGVAGFVDGNATQARLNTPAGIYYKNGFLYITDNLNNAIRKLDITTNILTTIAGTGAGGYLDGPALSATFFQPKSLVVDDSGTVFVADYENHVIRQIKNGIVSTYAGTGVAGFINGSAQTAQFWRPRDIRIDHFGNMYVAEVMNNCIRKISNGIVSTYAGTGVAGTQDGPALSATFFAINGIEFYNGSMYVSDANGHKIRKISANGVVSTVAGSGALGYIDGSCVSSQFSLLTAITLDNDGNIYVGDRDNNCIRIIASSSNIISGTVFNDANSNCTKENDDNAFTNWIVKAMPGSYYASTDSTGHYTLPLPAGTYTISQIIPNPFFWDTVCPAQSYSHVITTTSNTFATNLNFSLHTRVSCPILSVDVAAIALRRCRVNYYYANYKNEGNDTANNAYINIELDSLMTIDNVSIPVSAQNGNIYTFNIGTLLPGQTGSFYFGVYLDCGAVTGSTWCVKATMGPHSPCVEAIDSTWDHSSVKVTGRCDNGLACFKIKNTGSLGGGDMAGSSNYRIYENGILVHSGTFQLLGNTDTVICWPGNGNTIQLQADQRPGHPGHSHPNDYVEDCGTPSGTTPVFGIATATPQDDADLDVEMECLQVIGSFDPNDKTVIPAGIGADHYIRENDELEYRIRFQNTGNDTAFDVVIVDTLTNFLDPTTIVSGASSHPYAFKLLGNGIVRWTFANILLPDSTTNEPASHGFIKFKIKQKAGNVPGNRIENKVGIIFDFNEPVITNTAYSTVWQELVIAIKQNENTPVNTENNFIVFPNPSSGIINFEAKNKTENWKLTIYDVLGKMVYSVDVSNESKTSCDLNSFQKGMFFYKINSDGKTINSGKIIIQ